MKRHLSIAAVALLSAALASSQEKNRRAPDGHPDLSGMWAFGIDLPHGNLVKVLDGQKITAHYDQTQRHHASNDVPGALPWTPTEQPTRFSA